MSRLIDADVLMPLFIEKACTMKDRHGVKLGDEWLLNYNDIKDVIDNAPTVNKPNVITIPHDLIEKLVLCVVDTVETIPWSEAIEAYKSRPHGYWLNKQKDGWNCSECGEWSRSTDDFCKGCGADMRGGRE